MSVIWSGVTEEGAVVPVQVTTAGKVVATGEEGPPGPPGEKGDTGEQGPPGEYSEGDDVILGTGLFKGNVQIGEGTYGVDAISLGTNGSIFSQGVFTHKEDPAKPGSIACQILDGDTKQVLIYANGESVFRNTLYIGANGLTRFYPNGKTDFESNIVVGQSSTIKGNGEALFGGDVVIGSRGKTWLIRESNGVAMLVEQTFRTPMPAELTKEQLEEFVPEDSEVRDIPKEIDLITEALTQVMKSLKMTIPDELSAQNT